MRSADIPKIGNLSEDLILALLARLFSSLHVTKHVVPLVHNLFNILFFKNRLNYVSLKFNTQFLG